MIFQYPMMLVLAETDKRSKYLDLVHGVSDMWRIVFTEKVPIVIHPNDVDFDENCDPANLIKIKYDDILAASRRIVGAVMRTPCTRAHMSDKLGIELYLKQEILQYTGCFKERGFRNALMLFNDEQKRHGAVTASTGNHGIATAYHAAQLGIPIVLVLPTYTTLSKVAQAEYTGAKVILHGSSLSEAKSHAMYISKEKKLTYINGYDHPNVIEGHGTIGIEIVDQVPGVDAILIPVGGGSLLTGVAIAVKHLKPDTEIYGIETDKTCNMVESLRKNERITMEIDSTIAESLAVNKVGVNTFYNVKGLVDKMIIVKEDWVARAIMHLVETEKLIVEGAGAVGVAALMAGLFPNLIGKKVACILTGGNIDSTILSRALERGMTIEGRLVNFCLNVQDHPGQISELCSLFAEMGIAIRDCVPERVWVKGDVFSIHLKIMVETRGWEHTKEMMEQIKKRYKDYSFQEIAERPEKNTTARRGPCLAPNPVCMHK